MLTRFPVHLVCLITLYDDAIVFYLCGLRKFWSWCHGGGTAEENSLARLDPTHQNLNPKKTDDGLVEPFMDDFRRTTSSSAKNSASFPGSSQ